MVECETEGCDTQLSEKVEKFSRDRYGVPLCMPHQGTVGARILESRTPAAPQVTEEQVEQVKPSVPGLKQKVSAKSTLDKSHIINLQGKEYITHAGLLHAAHQAGLVEIRTQLESHDWDNLRAIFSAKVTMASKDGEKSFVAYGDASGNRAKTEGKPLECTLKVGMEGAYLRMAETRAINRALRLATDIGMTSIDEMPEQS